MVVTQIVMAAIMAMAPVHVRAFQTPWRVGMVISVPIGAMYLSSLVAGVLVNRVGRTPMAVAQG